ncbi:MAG TPA: acetamidase/formamidase family protein [Acidimicrobiales bacterium]|nr:acetamidase/formamidase family protein [Acidimicrobiales bacterium]
MTIDTVSHEGLLPDQGRDPVAFFSGHGVDPVDVLEDAVALASRSRPYDQTRDGPHVVCGPIWIEGAEPGDVVVVEVEQLLPRVPYGVVSNRHGRGALAGELPEAEGGGPPPQVVSRFANLDDTGSAARLRAPSGRVICLQVRPALGLVAVAPADKDAHSVPPGPHGGNLDLSLLGPGSRLYLPVHRPGALVQVGDPHFAQGDGEVALTALEGSLRAVVRFELQRGGDGTCDLPWAETADRWILVGLDEDLDEAVRMATRAGLRLVTEWTGLDRATAYAWLSAAADLSVSQVVNGTKGAHLSIPKAWLTTSN